MKSVEFGVAFVRGAVVTLDSEKEGLHFAQRTGFHLRREFFDGARELRFPSAEKPRQIVGVALGSLVLPFGRNGGLQISNALVQILQPDRLGRLRAAERLEMRCIETRSEYESI